MTSAFAEEWSRIPYMPDTGERHEISARVNAKEAETTQELKKLVSKTKERKAKLDAKNRVRGQGPVPPGASKTKR
jgi:hypothetical protein